MVAVIETRSLRKSFGDLEAVSDLSFTVESGQIIGLLGPNGAGKTTAIRMMTTLASIGGGTATIAGYDVRRQPDVVRQLIGLAGQAAAVDERLTARENLELFGRLYKLPRAQRKTRIEQLIERFDLGQFADRPVKTYSGGERRRLDVVAALVAQPLALFLDEPTTGLDPRSRADLWNAIRSLAADGTAIVLTTHYLEEVDHLADQILVLDRGSTVATGSPEELKRGLGRDVLEISFARPEDLVVAGGLLDERVLVHAEIRRIDVPVVDGADYSLGVLRRLQDAGVTITDFQLRRPTLDEVFLALTRTPAAPTDHSRDRAASL